ncbi:MAG: 1-acyl-sn-glycerol-3-phosphate acyltransferase [Bacteroidales bacterium]|nr:1-acyl-sn-glycerol-3-phosphate acyltransferase [Bacteroidales bacterium]
MKTIVSIWEWILASTIIFIYFIWFFIVAIIWPHKTYIKWVRKNLERFFKIMRIDITVVGAENIDYEGTQIFMPNHVSMFDIPLVLGFIPVNFWGIQAASHFKVPLYGWVLKQYGNIPIDRSSIRASYRTMMDVVEEIKGGKNILILPEGTRTKTPKMGDFKKLPFNMAKKAGVAITPMAFVGLFDINNTLSKHIVPGKMKVVFGKQIDAETVKRLNENELRDLTKSKIQELIDNN